MNNELTEKELAEFTKGQNLIDRLKGLFDHQLENWKLARSNYEELNSSVLKNVRIDEKEVSLKHIPHRIVSSTADVSIDAVKKRECILCEENLPDDQRLIRYYKEYNFLVNPYPILSEHFTVAKLKHTPQLLSNYFNDLLLLSRDVGERYAVFYNGPKCGASLPEHLHFQMVIKNELPIYMDSAFELGMAASVLIETKKLMVYHFNDLGRIGFIVESRDTIELLNFYSMLNTIISKSTLVDEEPMFNLVAFYENKTWRIVIFLRRKHRPTIYYENEPAKIVVSPASIDLSGLIIVPRPDDLDKLDGGTIQNIFREVCITKEVCEYLLIQLKRFYN